jgi:hypothetical protein
VEGEGRASQAEQLELLLVVREVDRAIRLQEEIIAYETKWWGSSAM